MVAYRRDRTFSATSASRALLRTALPKTAIPQNYSGTVSIETCRLTQKIKAAKTGSLLFP
jgi:hypothetical protein